MDPGKTVGNATEVVNTGFKYVLTSIKAGIENVLYIG